MLIISRAGYSQLSHLGNSILSIARFWPVLYLQEIVTAVSGDCMEVGLLV